MTVRRLLSAAFAVFISYVLILAIVGEVLSRPARSDAGSVPASLPATQVQLTGSGNASIAGWYLAGERGKGTVLLLHGLRGDRRDMLGRAGFLSEAGYAVLLIDLPAHGESSGSRISFGAREAEGVRIALDYLHRELPGERIGVIAVSLGAAATVLAHPSVPPDAVVLESMYPTIEEAVANRLTMRLGPPGALFAPLLLWQLPWRTNVDARELRPIEHLPNLHAPVLIVSGSEDRHTAWQETLRLFEAAAAPKELWQVEGAPHVDLHAFQAEQYQRRILQFLETHLRGRD